MGLHTHETTSVESRAEPALEADHGSVQYSSLSYFHYQTHPRLRNILWSAGFRVLAMEAIFVWAINTARCARTLHFNKFAFGAKT